MSLPLAPLSAVLLSAFVAADAGSIEAKHDARLCAVFGAYLNALKSGNKTQLMLVQAACTTYATPKACRALTATPDRASVQATRACAVYGAYKVALDDVGIPGLMKQTNVPTDEHGRELYTLADAITNAASELAGRFVSIVDAALYVTPKPIKSDAEKEEAKAKKVAAEKVAQEQQSAAVDALADAKLSARGDAIALTLSDMARIVANAIKTGQLAADDVAEIDDALIVAETAALLALPVVDEVDHVDGVAA